MSFEHSISHVREKLDRLKALGALVRENAEPLSRRITDSSRLPASFTQFDIGSLVAILEDYEGLLRRLYEGTVDHPAWAGRRIDLSKREGRGDIAALLPYNGPAMTFGLAFAPAYLLGQNITVKPATESLNFFQTLSALMEEGGLGDLLRNPDGSRLFTSEPGVAFLNRCLDPTSPVAVLQIYGHDSYITVDVVHKMLRKRREFRLILEGPGKNRFTVCSPCSNLEYAAECIAKHGTVNGGQTCMGAEVFDVHEEVAPSLIPMVVEQVAALQVGDPYDPATQVGPMRDKMAQIIYAQIEDALAKGAKLEFATPKADGKYDLVRWEDGKPSFPKPTYRAGEKYTWVPVVVLSGVTEEMLVRREETFGPVIAFRTFREDAELLPQILNARYGLGGTLFGDDLEGRHAELRQLFHESAGTVTENLYLFDGAKGFNALHSPWGGYKRSRFAMVSGRFEGQPAVTEVQTGPSYTLVDFSAEKGVTP